MRVHGPHRLAVRCMLVAALPLAVLAVGARPAAASVAHSADTAVPCYCITEFPIGQGAGVRYLTAGPGGVWFSETDINAVARMTHDGHLTEFSDASATSGVYPVSAYASPHPEGITVGADSNLWFLEAGWPASLGRLTPAGALTDIVLLGYGGRILSGDPQSIVSGPDGNLWFTDPATGAIARFSLTSAPSGTGQQVGTVTEFPVPGALYDNGQAASSWWYAGPESVYWLLRNLVVGPDGALWFPAGTATIGRMTMSGAVTEYTLPSGSNVVDIAPGPDHALWFTEVAQTLVQPTPTRQGIGRIGLDGSVTEYIVSLPAWHLATGSDGNLWFTTDDQAVGGTTPVVGRLFPCTHATTLFAVPQHPGQAVVGAVGITEGGDGDLWFSETDVGNGNNLGRIAMDQVPQVKQPCASQGSRTAVPVASPGLRAAAEVVVHAVPSRRW